MPGTIPGRITTSGGESAGKADLHAVAAPPPAGGAPPPAGGGYPQPAAQPYGGGGGSSGGKGGCGHAHHRFWAGIAGEPFNQIADESPGRGIHLRIKGIGGGIGDAAAACRIASGRTDIVASTPSMTAIV